MFKPKAIYFEKGIENYKLGQELLEKYKEVPKIEIENHNNIEELRKKQNSEFRRYEKKFNNISVIIMSMTKAERKYPELLDKSMSRRERVAKGSGRPYPEVNALVKQFNEMKKTLKVFSGMDQEKLAQGKIPQNMMQPPKPKKGKGKGKGNRKFPF